MRTGVCLAVVIVAALFAASARADGQGSGSTTTTTGTTPTYAPLTTSSIPAKCVGAGVAAIVEQAKPALALGLPASTLGPSDYPDPNPWLTIESSVAAGSKCADESVTLDSVALFGGAVTATTVEGKDGKGTVGGLEIDGAPVTAAPGQTVAVENWGALTLGGAYKRISAPLSLEVLQDHDGVPAGTTIFLALSVASPPVAKKPPKSTPAHHSHTSAPATHRAKKHRQTKRTSRVPQPLTWTPRLGLHHYVFPVDGGASFVDTYGANRNDIYDGWHHGDDLFAPLGTPVVAVHSGTLSLVGWNALGGWRLWLTDSRGNSFYYAHLAGYSTWILTHRRVRAGQVLGFLGRTGDAFTTTPHLHFEIHPHQLIKLGYDGAVDPTKYLERWKVVHVPANAIPRPAKLVAPVGTPTQEATVVWRELLVARHLLPKAHPAKTRPAKAHRAVVHAAPIRRPFPPGPRSEPAAVATPLRRLAAVRLAATRLATPSSDGPWPGVALALIVAATLATAVVVRRRRLGKAPLH